MMPAMPGPGSYRRNTSLMRGLNYFEAVARHQSVKLAAAELGVSQSAVSHQLRELTEALGEQLVERAGRGIGLTSTGERLAARLAVAFAGLQSSVDEIVGGSRRALRLAVCSSFGPGWIIPLLQDFCDTYPGIDLQLCLQAQDPEQTDQVADAFVTALAVRPGFAAVRIVEETLVAVHAPHGPKAPRRLITTELGEGTLGDDWQAYCRNARLRLSEVQKGSWLQCSHYLFAVDMAKAGLGVALVPDFLARHGIGEGTLAYFDKSRMPTGRVYHLCYKNQRAGEHEIKCLAAWIKAQAAAASVVKTLQRSAG